MADMGNIHKEIIIPNRIYLQGIQPETTEEELESKFRKYGSIIETRIIRDRITGEKKDYAFITFDSQQVAENVKATCKSVELHGTEIIVGTAKIQRRPKFFNRYHNNTTSPHHHHQGPPVPPPQPPQQPRFVSVPCTVSPDGLYTFHQQLLPICFPVEPGVPIDEEEYNQGLSPIPEEYSTPPEPAAPSASKQGPSLLPLLENSKHHFQPIEAPSSSIKKGAPVTVTASDYTSPTFAPSDIHRKLHPINAAGFQMGPNHLPIISNNHLEAANGVSPGELKNGMTANNIHMPNGNLPTSFANLPTSFGSHHPMNIADVAFLNGNMAYHYFPVATLMPPPNEWPPISPSHPTAVSQVEQANFVKPEPRKPNFNLPTSSSPMTNNRSNMPNRVTFSGNKMNGEHCGATIKNQPFLFMSTTHTKMNRVMTVQ